MYDPKVFLVPSSHVFFVLYLFSFQVKLKDSLMSSISFSQAKDAELAWLDGQIHINPAANLGQYIKGGNENEGARELNLVPILDALPSAEVCVCMHTCMCM